MMFGIIMVDAARAMGGRLQAVFGLRAWPRIETFLCHLFLKIKNSFNLLLEVEKFITLSENEIKTINMIGNNLAICSTVAVH